MERKRALLPTAHLMIFSLLLGASAVLSPPVAARDTDGDPPGRRDLTQLDPRFRKSVLLGWKYFQSSFAADNMACADCHLRHEEMISWAGAYPKVQVFDGTPYSVKTLRQVVVEAARRHTDLSDNEILQAADALVAYISWWGDGQPVRPGISESTPPAAADRKTLRRCRQRGKEILLSTGTRGCGRCHTTLGGLTPSPEISGAILSFPRYDPAVDGVVSLDTFLRRHAAAEGFWLGDHVITAVSAFAAHLARGRTLKPGSPPPGTRPAAGTRP